MASLMDLCGSLRQGEQVWLQLIVIPIGFDWVKESEKEINKIFGRKGKVKPSLAEKGLEMMGEASEVVYSIWGDIESKGKEEKPRTMMDLTPGEKRKVESIQEKSAKLAFDVKIRFVYVAKREVMNKAKVANGIVGYMKQFAALDLNNLKPDVDKTMTKAMYFFKDQRLLEKQRKIFRGYIKRSDTIGRTPGLFNIEELATIWHFPVEANVKSPLIQKAPGRKADAPSALPLAQEISASGPEDSFRRDILSGQPSRPAEPEELQSDAAAPPNNLPMV